MGGDPAEERTRLRCRKGLSQQRRRHQARDPEPHQPERVPRHAQDRPEQIVVEGPEPSRRPAEDGAPAVAVIPQSLHRAIDRLHHHTGAAVVERMG